MHQSGRSMILVVLEGSKILCQFQEQFICDQHVELVFGSKTRSSMKGLTSVCETEKAEF